MWHIEHTICLILPFQIVKNVKKPAKTETGLCSDVLFRRILIMPRNIKRIKQSISCFLSFRPFESLIYAYLWYITHIPRSFFHFALTPVIFTSESPTNTIHTYQVVWTKHERQIVIFFLDEAWFCIHYYNCTVFWIKQLPCVPMTCLVTKIIAYKICMMRSLRRSMPFHLKITPFT